MSADVGTDHCRVVPPVGTATGFEQFEFYRHLFSYVEANRRIPSESHVLEVGPGEGYGADYLARCAFDVMAVDLSLQALQHARNSYPNVQLCQAFATNLPLRSAFFNAVVSFQVIEHVQDTESYLKELGRVLKPDGQVLLTTPNRKLRLLPFQKPWNPYHVREYSAYQLRRTLKKKFECVEIWGITTRADLLSEEMRRVKQSPFRAYGAMLARWLRGGDVKSHDRQEMPQSSQVESENEASHVPLLSVSLDDFHISSDFDRCLDLFAIASRPR